MGAGWATWYHWVRRWFAGGEYAAPAAEAEEASGPTVAYLFVDGTRARVADANSEAVDLTERTRARVY